MKLASALVSLTLATSLLQAGDSSSLLLGTAVIDPAPLSARDWSVDIKDALELYKSDEGWLRSLRLGAIIQYQVASVQPNGSNGKHFKDGASPFNSEFRRLWLTMNASTDTGTSFNTIWKLGGIPGRETYPDGQRKQLYNYAGLFTIWVNQEIDAVDGLSVKLGKVKTLFTDEYITSATAIKTIERSILANQNMLESNWGVELRYEPIKHRYLFLQLLANDRAATAKLPHHSDSYRDGRGLKGEFGWEDKFFSIIGGSYRFAKTEQGYQNLSFQYAHDFDNTYSGEYTAGANDYGIQALDAISLGHAYVSGDFAINTSIVSNIEMKKADYSSGSGKNIGVSMIPSYKLTPHVELVGRYAVITGQGACNLAVDRYITTQTNTDKWVDSVNALYLGANYYYSTINPNAAKLMFGMEYSTARKGGKDVYNGWTYSSAIRFAF